MNNSLIQRHQKISIEDAQEEWILFHEEQIFRPLGIAIYFAFWATVLGLIMVPPIYKSFILGKATKDWFTSYCLLPLLCSGVFAALLAGLVQEGQNRLITLVKTDEINIYFSPRSQVGLTIPIANILNYRIRRYKPRLEYFGWGRRWGIRGKAYTAMGTWGIQFTLKHGERFLIGTQRPTEFLAALDRIQGLATENTIS